MRRRTSGGNQRSYRRCAQGRWQLPPWLPPFVRPASILMPLRASALLQTCSNRCGWRKDSASPMQSLFVPPSATQDRSPVNRIHGCDAQSAGTVEQLNSRHSRLLNSRLLKILVPVSQPTPGFDGMTGWGWEQSPLHQIAPNFQNPLFRSVPSTRWG